MHMHTLTHVRAVERAHMHTQNVRAGECAHMHVYVCTLRVHEIHAPEGCRKKSTHPKGATTEAKRGHEKHNRTLTPAHTCYRVKIVRAEIAPRMRAHARV